MLYLYPTIPDLFGQPHWFFLEEEQPAVVAKTAIIRTNKAFLVICCIFTSLQVKHFSENFIVFV
jgi:phage terminase large subunit-like protein